MMRWNIHNGSVASARVIGHADTEHLERAPVRVGDWIIADIYCEIVALRTAVIECLPQVAVTDSNVDLARLICNGNIAIAVAHQSRYRAQNILLGVES